MKPLIALVHATSLAIAPATRVAPADKYRREDLLNERLLEGAEDRGSSFQLFRQTLQQAEAFSPAAIVTTCSMYTRDLPRAREQIETPVMGVDEAMIERAAEIGGEIALVASIETALDNTAELIHLANPDAEITERLLVDRDAAANDEKAAELASRCRDLAQKADAVVVVQLSLSAVEDHLDERDRERILTSPPTAYSRLAALLRETGAGSTIPVRR